MNNQVLVWIFEFSSLVLICLNFLVTCSHSLVFVWSGLWTRVVFVAACFFVVIGQEEPLGSLGIYDPTLTSSFPISYSSSFLFFHLFLHLYLVGFT